jgi:phosphoglycerate dehydrogenase-like enzyme
MKPNILFLRKFSKSDTKYLVDSLSDHYNIIVPSEYTDENLIHLAKNADVFLGNIIFQELIEAASELKVVQSQGAGVDNINLKLLAKRNIYLCNSHGNSWYVAEHAVGMLFSLIKKLHTHDRLMRQGEWFRMENKETDLHYLSDTIRGMIIGFVGYGHIARHIAKFLGGYDTEFLAFRKNTTQTDSEQLVEFTSLDKVFSQSDAIFVAVPLTTQTRNMITAEKFVLMKKTAYIVNVARGPVVNQKSLFEALAGNIIGGAGIDVWYDDYRIESKKKYPSKLYPFHELDNVLLSPYRAGYIKLKSPHLEGAVKNLKLYAQERKLLDVVNIESGY